MIRRFLTFFVLALGLATPAWAARQALVIGNSAYQQGPLKNPVNDARAMDQKLTSLGFTVQRVENMKRQQIGRVLSSFANAIKPGDEVVVFYAGHGVQVKGVNYLPAVDAEIESEEEVPLNSLNLNSLMDRLDEAKAGLKVLLLDACRNNPYARSFRSGDRGLARVASAPSGTLIHFATRPGSVAADGSGANGLYTTELLKHIDSANTPIETVLKRVSLAVELASKGQQEPWVEGSIRGEFYFKTGPGMQLASVAPVATGVHHSQDPEEEAWAATKALNTPAAYNGYLAEYPSGRFASAARIARGAAIPAATFIAPAAVPAATAVVTPGKVGAQLSDVSQLAATAAGLSNRDGAVVVAVVANGPADKGGAAPGDVVISIDGSPVLNAGDMIAKISISPPGSQKAVQIVRGRQRIGQTWVVGGSEVGTTLRTPFPQADPELLAYTSVDRKLPRDLARRYQLSDAVLATIENSPAFRAAPHAKDMELRVKSTIQVEFTGSSSRSLPKPEPISVLETKRLRPLGPCVVSFTATKNSSLPAGQLILSENLYCFGMAYGGSMSQGALLVRVDSLDIQGSLFPMQLGASMEVKTKTTTPSNNSSDSHNSKCTVESSQPAKTLNSQFTGTAWKLGCETKTGLFSANKKSTSYYYEDLGLFDHEFGTFDMKEKGYFLPTPKTERITLEVDGSYGSRQTVRYDEVELQVLPNR